MHPRHHVRIELHRVWSASLACLPRCCRDLSRGPGRSWTVASRRLTAPKGAPTLFTKGNRIWLQPLPQRHADEGRHPRLPCGRRGKDVDGGPRAFAGACFARHDDEAATHTPSAVPRIDANATDLLGSHRTRRPGEPE